MAIVVILLAGALGAAWAFIVPIFQATDEAAHFDYAISIFSAGHLISTSGKRTEWIASPSTRYLLRATDYFRIAFHSSMRVQHGYGSLAYYRRLDANAPGIEKPEEQGRISFIAASYPFGFYALEAAWMKIIAVFTSSLVAAFFGARLLCVFLTMLGLYFNYRTAINVGVPPWLTVAIVTAVGFFPLTTLVSSYVQPDDLAYALVSASVFFATQLRASKHPLMTVATIGICVGFLGVTKYQFFLSVAIPVTLLVLARLWLRHVQRLVAFVYVLVLLAPTIALMSVQFELTAPTYAQVRGSAASSTILGAFYHVLQSGMAATILYFLKNSVKAIMDFYVSGPNAATFWEALGLWDTPLIVVNEHVELAIRVVTAVASVVVATIIVYRIARNVSRLGKIALRGRACRAVLIASSDPILNSYLLFTAVMFTLYVVTDDVFGAAGRHWYPYVFAGFLCATWYAPRTFRYFRRRSPVMLFVAVAIYSLVSSGYATAAVLDRYYGKESTRYVSAVPAPSRIARGIALGFLWPIQGMDFHPLSARRYRDTFPLGSRLWAGGAAIFPNRRRAADEVAIVIDGRLPARTLAGLYNFQVAEATRNMTYAYSGFFGAFSTAELSEGAHVITAYARVPDSMMYQEIAPRRSFFLMPSGRFSRAFLQRLRRTGPSVGSLDRLEFCQGGPPPAHGILAVSSGDLLLARGRLANGSAEKAVSVIWLLVDDKPYPAEYGKDGRSFFGTIPTLDLAPGLHRVSAYIVTPQASRYRLISGRKEFIVTSHRPAFRLTWTALPMPTECSDPLGLLAGT